MENGIAVFFHYDIVLYDSLQVSYNTIKNIMTSQSHRFRVLAPGDLG